MTPCPIVGCPNGVHTRKLMCFSCWARVPFKLQMKVQSAWRNFQQASKPNMKLACLRAYREARDEAIASLAPKVPA